MDIIKLTGKDLQEYLRVVKTIFPIVRILDKDCLKFQMVNEDGSLNDLDFSNCYNFWGRRNRCKNCISAKIMQQKSLGHKFEIKDDQLFVVFSRYVEVDGVSRVIEMLATIDNDMIKTGSKDLPFKEAILHSNELIYKDPLLNIYNRRFYEEQMLSLNDITAVAFIDIDYFKSFNDHLGHNVGDLVLKLIVEVIGKHIRKYDALIRMGGDEFLIAFSGFHSSRLKDKLMDIKRYVQKAKLPEHPDLTFDISVGGCSFNKFSKQAVVLADEQMYKVKHCPDKVAVIQLNENEPKQF